MFSVGENVWVKAGTMKERYGVIRDAILDRPDSKFYVVEFDPSTRKTYPMSMLRRGGSMPVSTFKITTDTKAVKSDHDKPDLSLIPKSAKVGIALAMMDGQKKYGRYNYLEGMDWSRLIGAADRHISSFNDGEDLACDSNLNHLYHAAANICMLIEYYEKKLGNDNRFKGNKK